MALTKYTGQGIKAVKDSPARLEGARQLGKKMGVEVKSFYLAMGRYDLIVIFEAPDDATMTKFLLTLGSSGNVSTETLRIFPEAEYKSIVAGLP
jgi:uncharacterized protein with GYD domain